MERVIYLNLTGERQIVYETNYYKLRPAAEMADMIHMALSKQNSSVQIMNTEITDASQIAPHEYFFLRNFDRSVDLGRVCQEKLFRMLKAYHKNIGKASHPHPQSLV